MVPVLPQVETLWSVSLSQTRGLVRSPYLGQVGGSGQPA